MPDVIEFSTNGLHGIEFDWRHYGGPLALFRLCRFVRYSILKEEVRPRQVVPLPGKRIFQIGDMIVEQVDEIPPDARRVEVETLPDAFTSAAATILVDLGSRRRKGPTLEIQRVK